MDYHSRILEKTKNEISKLEGKREELTASIKIKKKTIRKNEKLLSRLETAKWVLAEASKLRQNNFKEYLNRIITKAIASVYDRDLTFKLTYAIKARKSQAVPLILENEKEQDPEEDVGVGLLDVISFPWRLTDLLFSSPKRRKLLWLDEPMRNIGHGRLILRASDMMKSLADNKEVQLIINTHEPELIKIADKVFFVNHNGEHSTVTSENLVKKRTKLTI